MKANRNIYLTFSLGLLVAVSFALFLFTWEEDRPEIDRNFFSLLETEKIDRVRLQSARDTVELSFDGARWRVNDQWDADMQMIKVLMATLRQAEPHRPVAESAMDTVRKQLERLGTQVVLEEGSQEKLNFRAGGNSQMTESWFLKENDVRPFVMIIPGYRVYVSGILQMKVEGWRSKRIFDFNWRNFKSLAVDYPREPKQGFSVEMKQRYFGIKEVPQVDTTKLNDYLDAVSLLMANRYVPQTEQVAGKVMAEEPVFRIEIQDIASRTYTLDLFAPSNSDEKVYGRLSGGEVVAFDRNVISAISRRRGYFVSPESR